jgi:hypothetical protein
MIRVVRFALLVIMTFLTISLVIGIGGEETGPLEKAVLGVAVVGLVVAARPVRRLGSVK